MTVQAFEDLTPRGEGGGLLNTGRPYDLMLTMGAHLKLIEQLEAFKLEAYYLKGEVASLNAEVEALKHELSLRDQERAKWCGSWRPFRPVLPVREDHLC